VYVHPAYYGMLMFAHATPPGSRLLRTSGPAASGLSTWATLGRDGATRVALINKDLRNPRLVAVRAPSGTTAGTVELLRAPSIRATSGITLAGQSFGAQTSTGQLAGPAQIMTLKPARNRFSVRLPAGSAALLTIPRS
jgi:hypothetical protein